LKYEGSTIYKNKNIGFIIAVIGGIGLGILLGSEFPGSYITIVGAILLLIVLGSLIFLSYKKKKIENDLSPGSKTFEEIGELTELSYELRDRSKDKEKK